MTRTAPSSQNLSSGDDNAMQDLTDTKVAVGRIEEQLKSVVKILDEYSDDRKAQTERLGALERQQERHSDSTTSVLNAISKQLAEFILHVNRKDSESTQAIQTLASRLKPLEDDLRNRQEREMEDRRRSAVAERAVRRMKAGAGLLAVIAGGLYAAKDGLHGFMKWLAKLVT